MSAYPRPIHCVDCECDFKPEKNGVYLLEMADFGPYKLWNADLWKCPSCGREIISGYGKTPVASHHEEDFYTLLGKVQNSNKLYINHTRK